MLQIILYIPCLRPRISHLSKDSWTLLLENSIRNRYLNARSLSTQENVKITESSYIPLAKPPPTVTHQKTTECCHIQRTTLDLDQKAERRRTWRSISPVLLTLNLKNNSIWITPYSVYAHFIKYKLKNEQYRIISWKPGWIKFGHPDEYQSLECSEELRMLSALPFSMEVDKSYSLNIFLYICFIFLSSI